jgi:hypothetical protein
VPEVSAGIAIQQSAKDRFQFFHLREENRSGDPSKSRFIAVKWLRIRTESNWPDRYPARVRLIPTDSTGPEVVADSHAVPTFDVKLPKGPTVVLRISSAAVDGSADSPEYFVHLSRLSQLCAQDFTALSSHISGPMTAFEELASVLKTKGAEHLTSPNSYVDGSIAVMTPHRNMTLVHAVRQPIEPPEFAAPGTQTPLLQIVREPGKSEAHVIGGIHAHWLSTGKITCYAEWTDQVDDVSRSAPGPVHHREVAFTVTSKELALPDTPSTVARSRTLINTLFHHFPGNHIKRGD